MSTHTPGNLSVRNKIAIYSVDEGGKCIAVTSVSETDVEDARRLVACWNACDGIPTESIECDLNGLLMGAVRRTNSAEAQRDELLAALKQRTDDFIIAAACRELRARYLEDAETLKLIRSLANQIAGAV